MPKAVRHPILYDVERWRRYRTWLLLPATVCAVTAVLFTVLMPSAGAGFGYSIISVALFSMAFSLWSRQRFTYLVRDGDRLVVKTMVARRRLGASDIERARVVRLAALFHRPERRRLLPRPAERWLNTEAIALRLGDGVDRRALRRLLGPRCVVDDMLVVPLRDASGLLAEVLEHVCPPRVVTAGVAARRRPRRR